MKKILLAALVAFAAVTIYSHAAYKIPAGADEQAIILKLKEGGYAIDIISTDESGATTVIFKESELKDPAIVVDANLPDNLKRIQAIASALEGGMATEEEKNELLLLLAKDRMNPQ